ncbi:rab-GTPase-TBC domain-containing protein [Sporodiniella umbellata]|nr:rab-GTPase-TBC domain-containing protein [Sporodiniella umbellata]
MSPMPVWVELANAQEQVNCEKHLSPSTVNSSDTDFTTSSIAMSVISNKREILQQYEQRPEKVPDIATEMEKWFAMTDRYGFLEKDSRFYDSLWAKEKEVKRAEKWADMSKTVLIHGETAHIFYSNKLSRRVYKGIPDCWRRDVWYYLITDHFRAAKEDLEHKKSYQELLQEESPHERQIDLDIPRTLRDHIMFKQRYGSGQRALFSVLRAFANHDQEVGYCQGMTNIAATILMYCEEEASCL